MEASHPSWIIQAEPVSQELISRLIIAVTKILNFEQQVVLTAYENNGLEPQKKQYEIIKEELKERIGAVSQELAALTQQTSASAEQLAASSHEVKQFVAADAQKAQESQVLVFKGENRVSRMETGMQEISDSSVRIHETVSDLVRSVDQIRLIVHIVEELANQTKLLSLNASLEASLSGILAVEKEIGSMAGVIQEVGAATDRIATMAGDLNDTMESL